MKKLTGEAIRNLPKKKKMIISGVAVVAGVAILGAGVAAYASNTVQKNVIGSDAAVSIALDDANVSTQEARIEDVDLDLKQGTLVYDVEFEAGQVDYDYEIKATDGTILNRFAEADGEKVEITTTQPASENQAAETTTAADEKTQQAAGAQSGSGSGSQASASEKTTTAKKTTTANSSSAVTLAQAKSIALKYVGLSSSDVRFTKAETDYDDGVKEYDIEFVSGNYEYEFEVRASDGKILSYDRETTKGQTTTAAATTSSTKYIGVDKAKSIALKDSGVSASNASFVKAKLEKEDGVYVYEIEFYSGNMEYEYEINAKTGKILDRSAEREDHHDD